MYCYVVTRGQDNPRGWGKKAPFLILSFTFLVQFFWSLDFFSEKDDHLDQKSERYFSAEKSFVNSTSVKNGWAKSKKVPKFGVDAISKI